MIFEEELFLWFCSPDEKKILNEKRVAQGQEKTEIYQGIDRVKGDSWSKQIK